MGNGKWEMGILGLIVICCNFVMGVLLDVYYPCANTWKFGFFRMSFIHKSLN